MAACCVLFDYKHVGACVRFKKCACVRFKKFGRHNFEGDWAIGQEASCGVMAEI